MPPAVEAQSLNHWTASEVPEKFYFQSISSSTRQSTNHQPTHSPTQQLVNPSLQLSILDDVMMNDDTVSTFQKVRVRGG